MLNLGLQLYTVRGTLDTREDIIKNFHRLRKMGYTEFQTAGAFPLLNMSAKEMKDILIETDTKFIGSHVGFEELAADTEGFIENHLAVDCKNIGVGGAPRGTFDSAENVLRFIDECNAIAQKAQKAGLKFTYHNHSVEFKKFGGRTIMDMLIDGLDPASTSICLDSYWVQHGGGDVIAWIKKLAGKIDILHIKDMMITDDGPDDTEVFEGNMNFEGIIEAAREIGVKHYVMELDNPRPDPYESAKICADNMLARYSNSH